MAGKSQVGWLWDGSLFLEAILHRSSAVFTQLAPASPPALPKALIKPQSPEKVLQFLLHHYIMFPKHLVALGYNNIHQLHLLIPVASVGVGGGL